MLSPNVCPETLDSNTRAKWTQAARPHQACPRGPQEGHRAGLAGSKPTPASAPLTSSSQDTAELDGGHPSSLLFSQLCGLFSDPQSKSGPPPEGSPVLLPHPSAR